jgi:predicted RND superfamily exporter protein
MPLATWANFVGFIFRSIPLIKYDMGSLSVTGILLGTLLALVVLFGTFLDNKWLYSIS